MKKGGFIKKKELKNDDFIYTWTIKYELENNTTCADSVNLL